MKGTEPMSNSSELCRVEMTEAAILVHRPDGLTDERWEVLRANIKSGLDWLVKPADPAIVREVRALRAELDAVGGRLEGSLAGLEARVEREERRRGIETEDQS